MRRILTKMMMTFWTMRMTMLGIKRWKRPMILVIKEVTSQREMHRSLILHLSPARCYLTSHKQAALVKEILDIACAQVIEEASFKVMNEADDGAPISTEGAFEGSLLEVDLRGEVVPILSPAAGTGTVTLAEMDDAAMAETDAITKPVVGATAETKMGSIDAEVVMANAGDVATTEASTGTERGSSSRKCSLPRHL